MVRGMLEWLHGEGDGRVYLLGFLAGDEECARPAPTRAAASSLSSP